MVAWAACARACVCANCCLWSWLCCRLVLTLCCVRVLLGVCLDSLSDGAPGRGLLMQRTGGVERSESDEWVVASKDDVARVSVQWEGLKFLIQECVPYLMEVGR